MHPSPDSMADKVADHMETARLGVFLHRSADVAEVLAGNHLLDGQLEALSRRAEQFIRPWHDLPDRHCDRAVAHEPIEHRAEVETDDVSLLHL